MQITSITKITLCAIATMVIAIAPARAQEAAQNTNSAPPAEKLAPSPLDILPAKSAKTDSPSYSEAFDTHPPLKISPDKSELIRLDKDAGSIIVGSPSHLSVLADSARTLVLVPQLPGATYVTVLDKQGNVLMQRHVIIGSPKKKYVRIRKSCNGDQEGCEPTQVYYCPDMCHKVNVAREVTEPVSSATDIPSGNANLPTDVVDSETE